MMRRALLLALLALAGCGSDIPETGKDAAILADPATPAQPVPHAQLLPLKPGNRWFMTTRSEDTAVAEVYVVGSTLSIRGVSGIVVDALRNNKPWRREVYRQSPEGLLLLAFGDAGKPLMPLTPPMPLTRATVVEGDTVAWTGTIRIDNRDVPSRGFSRVSLRENIQSTRAGINDAFRIDTIVTLQSATGTPTHFPTIRWLCPGIGFVRRAFVDTGKAAQGELDKVELH